MRSRGGWGGVVVLLLALASCGGDDAGAAADAPGARSERVSYQPVGPDAVNLRSAFDSDSGKVRGIFLASPT